MTPLVSCPGKRSQSAIKDIKGPSHKRTIPRLNVKVDHINIPSVSNG